MKLIHRMHRFNKLFTLKRSCFLANSTLKRSWVYAETLLRSIYTCIYLYKKTCSWEQQVVNKSFFEKIKSVTFIFSLMLTTSLVTSCQKSILVSDLKQPDLRINQRPATITQPARYYVCGGCQYPCRSVTNKWQKSSSRRTNKHQSVSNQKSKLMNKKPKEHHHAVPNKIRSCQIKSV